MQYADILEQLPEELRLPVHKLLERLREELLDSVKRSDFERLEAAVTELTEQVRNLAQAQARTEASLEGLAQAQARTEASLKELTQAHKNLEARVEKLTERVEELALAQARTEASLKELAQAHKNLEARVEKLTERVEELALAQARTEASLKELAQAHKNLEARVEELARAQVKTEATVQDLIRGQLRIEKELASLSKEQAAFSKEQKDMRRELGGISHTIGFTLENQSYPRLPAALMKDFGVEIARLYPRFLVYPDGRQDQINIYGEGTKGGKPVYALGEAKAQLGKRDIDSFLQLVRRAVKALPAPAVSFMVTYLAEPAVEEYARQKGLKVYWFHALPEPGFTRIRRSHPGRKTHPASSSSF